MTLARQQQRRDTAANWALYNPVLLDGELGVDATSDRIKVGDGVTSWDALPYADRLEDSQAAVTTAQAAAVESQAAAAGARDISNIAVSDDVVEALIKGTAGAGPKTRTALSASIDQSVKQTVNLVFDGDSLTAGSTLPPQFAFPRQVADGVANATVTNLGVHGQSVIDMAADAATQVDPLYDPTPGVRNVLVVWCGTNDLAVNGAAPTATHTALKNYCLARKAAGFEVVVLTTIPRNDPDVTGRAAYNTLIRNNWATYADALVDTDTDAVFGNTAAVNWPKFYRFEKTHLTRAGIARIAALVKPALNRLGVTTAQDQTMKQEGVSSLFVPASSFVPFNPAAVSYSDQFGETPGWRMPKTAVLSDRLVTSIQLPADWTAKPITRLVFAGIGSGSTTTQPSFFLSVRPLVVGSAILDGGGSTTFSGNAAGDGVIVRQTPDGAFWPTPTPNTTLAYNMSLGRFTNGGNDTFTGTVLFLGVELIAGNGIDG